ncbi:MAG TPA: double-strand break repair protein AddB, partial [Rhizobiales bacterium]|nr:double-strand break repair protein AddB [Hyphomicrobiales bacterium]
DLEKLNGAPTVPSRWLSRLEAVAAGLGLENCFNAAEPWLDWVQGLDHDNSKPAPVKAPCPRPRVDARPRSMSVTEIETWIRDPYAIYARRILGLQELDELEASPDASHRGIIIHDAVQKFIDQKISPAADDALERLLEIGRNSFAQSNIWPGVQTLWWPRFERMAQWFIETEIARQQGVEKHITEVSGRLVFDQGGAPFTLRARADRIDLVQNGDAAIIYDYKTGTVPSASEVFSGFSPQLPLEAAILTAGGFENVPAGGVAQIVYIKLSGGNPPGEMRILEKSRSGVVTPAEAADAALAGLRHRISSFNHRQTPYLSRIHVKFERFPGTYDHLARAKEWQRFDIEDAG